MRYELADGRVIHLRYHTPEEWGEAFEARLLELGCSPVYAAAARASFARKED